MRGQPIIWCSWNIERGGADKNGSLHRRDRALECAAQLAGTHVTVVCEANNWHRRLDDTVFADEMSAALGAHSRFVAPHGQGHTAVFIAGPVTLTNWDPQLHWLATGAGAVDVGGGIIHTDGWPDINLGALHLSPWGWAARYAQANRLVALGDRGLWVLLGDWNTSWPRDPEPDWAAARTNGITRAQIHYHKTPDSSLEDPRIDRHALTLIDEMGWADLAELYDAHHPAATGPHAIDQATSGFWSPPEQTPLETRKLRALASPDLAEQITVIDYQTFAGPAWRKVSDHGAFRATTALIPAA